MNWSPTKIGLGNLIEGVKEQNIVEKLKRIYNPLSEDFGEKEPETLPMIDAQEAFGSVEDIPF